MGLYLERASWLKCSGEEIKCDELADDDSRLLM